MTHHKLKHFIAGAAIYTLAQFFSTPLEALFAVAVAGIAKESWDSAQARKEMGRYTFNPLNALAVLGGGLLIYLPGLTR